MLSSEVVKHYRVHKGSGFRLKDFDPADTGGLDIEKDEAKELLAAGVKRLAALQERLYADHNWAILIILQAMDAAGKDGVVEHVMSGVNPQGCDVHSFKAPSPQELNHDFLWRTTVALPQRGHIGIFNRSYYEEVLVVRVHQDLLARQQLPPQLVTKDIWKERFEDIGAFERHLVRNGIVPIKFFLNVSREEQRRRFLERIDNPAKQWKFSLSDVAERQLWPRYMDAYEDMIRHTATKDAPWHVVPADNKRFTRLVVAAAIVEQLEKLDLEFPKVEAAAQRELRKARAALAGEEPRKKKALRRKA